MMNRYFTTVYNFIARHLKYVQIVILLLIVISAFGLRNIKLSNNIESMLPAREEIFRSIRFLRESGLSDKVILSVSSQDPTSDISDLIRDTDLLASDLQCDLITEVLSSVPEANVIEDILSFMRYVPQLTDSNRLDEIQTMLTEEHIEKRVSAIYTKLLSPGGSMMIPFYRNDPLSISGSLMKNMQGLSAALGYRVDIVQGRLISQDRKNMLLVLDTPVLVTDGAGSKELLNHIASCIDKTDSLKVTIVAGHVHSVSNEMIIRKDVARTCIIATLAFFLLFLLTCKDLRVGFVFLMPLIAILLSINISAILLGAMSYFIAGFGAVIAGIAIDYGIHIYIAKKCNGDEGVHFVAKPVVIGSLTTLSVFFAFFFSSVQGYSELACFSILSILLCLILSLFLLPHLIKHDGLPASTLGNLKNIKLPNSKILCIGWLLFLLICGAFISRLVIDTDIKNFDGSAPEVFEQEADFHRIWGGDDQPAIMVSEAADMESAIKLNDSASAKASEILGQDKLLTLASIWKPYAIRKENLTRWNSFWKDGEEASLRNLLNKSAEKRDFTKETFDPFFNSLYSSRLVEGLPDDIEFLAQVLDRFVITNENKTMVLSYFDDNRESLMKVAPAVNNDNNTYLVSRNQLSISISEAVESEIAKLSLIGGLLIISLLFILLRKLHLVLLALVPVVTSIAAMLALLPLLGMQLNAASIISAMVVVGLCIDYGIFMIYHNQQPAEGGLRLAVGLSAATTLIGAGALLFANHPVMFSIGITLTSGVLAGYLSAAVIIPALFELTRTAK